MDAGHNIGMAGFRTRQRLERSFLLQRNEFRCNKTGPGRVVVPLALKL